MQWGGASGVFGVHHRLSAEGAGEAKKARELMKKLFEIIGDFQAIPMWLASFTPASHAGSAPVCSILAGEHEFERWLSRASTSSSEASSLAARSAWGRGALTRWVTVCLGVWYE